MTSLNQGLGRVTFTRKESVCSAEQGVCKGPWVGAGGVQSGDRSGLPECRERRSRGGGRGIMEGVKGH